MSMLKQLWNDECGAILSMEAVLLATILVIGVVTGLSAVSVAVVTELADVGGAIAAVNQSYKVGGNSGHHAAHNGSAYNDLRDSCDEGIVQGSELGSRCIVVCVDPSADGTGEGDEAGPISQFSGS